MAQTSEKLELISGLKESLSQKEIQYKDVSEKLLQAEHAVSSLSVVSNVDSDNCAPVFSFDSIPFSWITFPKNAAAQRSNARR